MNAATVEPLYRRLVAVLDHPDELQVIFVDDACPAGSGAALDRLSGDHAEVEVLHLATNTGQHRAALAGLARAGGEWSVVMDADLQDPPEAVPALLEKGRQGYDVVFAGRRGRYQSPVRMLTSRAFKRALAVACGLPADAGTFVLLRRGAVDRLLTMDGPPPHLPAMIGRAGLRIASIPVRRAPREQGSSAYASPRRAALGLNAMRWALWRRLTVPRRSP